LDCGEAGVTEAEADVCAVCVDVGVDVDVGGGMEGVEEIEFPPFPPPPLFPLPPDCCIALPNAFITPIIMFAIGFGVEELFAPLGL
jgi:hypothetical protein